MTGWMPGASRAQNFSGSFVGRRMKPRVVVLHSTEGSGWPGYGGGATAPHVTIDPRESDPAKQIRQHFPVTESARALENRAGGVETNTEGAVQVELIGTCDPAALRKWARGRDVVFWPKATADDVAPLLRFLRWLEAEHGVPLVDATPRGWYSYPASYGNSDARMSGKEWVAARGIVGHQHVPENSHGDPGDFPIHLITNQEDDMPMTTEEKAELADMVAARVMRAPQTTLGGLAPSETFEKRVARIAVLSAGSREGVRTVASRPSVDGGGDPKEIANETVALLKDLLGDALTGEVKKQLREALA